MTAETLREPDEVVPPSPRVRWCVPSRLLVGIAMAWLAFTVVYLLGTGRSWLWLLPGLVPPLAFVAVPVLIAAMAGLLRLLRRPMRSAPRTLVLAAAVVALVAGAGRSGIDPAVFGGGDGPAPAGAPTIVSWNTEYWDQGEDPNRFYAYLHAHPADVYLLQEYIYQDGDSERDPVDLARLRTEFPGYTITTRGELLTLSRFPVIATTRVGPDRGLSGRAGFAAVFESAKVLRTDLRIGGSVLSVYNVHLPVQVDVSRNPLHSDFYGYLQARDGTRKAQLAGLVADVTANPHPVLIAGDFNTSPAMGDLDGLRGVVEDADRAGSSPYPASWPASAPLWRLDWTFTTPGVRVYDYRFVNSEGHSDHDLQQVRISLAGGR